MTADFGIAAFAAALDRLNTPLRESLARSMAVAGGQVIRDEAKLLAPMGTADDGSAKPGALRDAIYLAYKPGRSDDHQYVYSVSWNAKKAPHGHLLEFGHWRTNVVYKAADGHWYSDPKRKLPSPIWVPAHAFLRPALTSSATRARDAMFARGQQRLGELLTDPASQDVLP
ncbi:MAG: HK97 gp10 family phage protein [Dyella sp.]